MANEKFSYHDFHNWIWRSLQANAIDPSDLVMDEAVEVVLILCATNRTIGFKDYLKFMPKKTAKMEYGQVDKDGSVQLYDKQGRPAGRIDPFAFIGRFSGIIRTHEATPKSNDQGVKK